MPQLTQHGIMVIPVVGGLMHRGDSLDAASGSESYTNLSNLVVAGLEDPDCKGIMLDVDSPGGEAGGCFEFADMILEARAHKPVWGLANAQACSAAYAILASCTKAFATPSAHVGSIGVAWLHVDIGQALKEQGIVTTWLYAGAHKVDGNQFEKLSKEVKAEFQASIDATYQQFVEAVAKRRPMSAEAIRGTEARVYRAQEAADLKLIDGLSTYRGVLDALAQSLGTKSQVLVTTPRMETTDMTITAEAHAAAVAEATEAGRVLGRQEASQILSSEHARGREALASEFAADASIKPERAIAMLQKSPAATAAAQPGVIERSMQNPANNPAVGVGAADPEQAAREARRAQLRNAGKGATLR
jgi:signal peptide peptidase SppA